MLAITVFAGCTPINVNMTLKDVESYITERPDSALTVLESIDRSNLKSNNSRAYHALLLAMALDKNYIDVTDDSLASVASRYYQKHGPKKYLARSLYYKGLSFYYDGKYDKAIIELTKSEAIAAAYDSLYLGFIKVLQANIYNIDYNDTKSVDLLEQALSIYTDLHAYNYVNIAKRELALAYANVKRYDDAERLLTELLSSDNVNPQVLAKTMVNYAFLMVARPDADTELAVNYYEKAAKVEAGKYMSRQDYWGWAYALTKTGNINKAQKIIDMMSPLDTSGTAYYWQYLIAKTQDKTSEALDFFEKFSDKNNEEVVQILKQSISSVQKDYYQSQYEISDYKLKVRSLILSITIISSTFIVTLIVYFVIRYRRKKEEEKEYYITYAEEVNRQLNELRHGTYSTLQKKYISMHKAKYETLQILFERYLQSEGRVDAERFIYKRVVSLVKDLRKDIEYSTDFENNLDSELNGILTNLRSELPELNKRYYKLFVYLALGFGSPVISHFMGCSENAVRIIKTRLKSTIKNSNAEHKSDFLEVIG